MDELAKWQEWVSGGRQGPAPSLCAVNLQKADLYGTDLRGANLQDADLEVAYMYCTNLRGANLRGAYLQGADLRGANLRCADLYRAKLYRANLRRACVYGTDLFAINMGFVKPREAYLADTDLTDLRNAKELIVDDPRGHRLLVVKYLGGWQVFAGCRYFKTIDDAIQHWSSPGYPDRKLGMRYVQALTNFAKEL